jgi:hypothetical protein
MSDRTGSQRQLRYQARIRLHAERWRAVCAHLGLDPDDGPSLHALLLPLILPLLNPILSLRENQ